MTNFAWSPIRKRKCPGSTTTLWSPGPRSQCWSTGSVRRRILEEPRRRSRSQDARHASTGRSEGLGQAARKATFSGASTPLRACWKCAGRTSSAYHCVPLPERLPARQRAQLGPVPPALPAAGEKQAYVLRQMQSLRVSACGPQSRRNCRRWRRGAPRYHRLVRQRLVFRQA